MSARLPTAGSLLLSCALVYPASAQPAPRILHDGVECLVAGRHAVIEALVEPLGELATVKVYFRAEIYPAFFFVEAEPRGDRYRAVLPRPTREVPSVVYYLEAVDSSFNSVRTEEFRPRVVLDAGDCDQDETQPLYFEGPATITLGGTAAGSRLPPGFLAEGIVGAVAAGRAAGSGTATLVAIGAAAGAAVGVGALAASGNDAQTTSVPIAGGVTTTVPITTSAPSTTSIPPSESVVACFDTRPNPPTIPVGDTVRFDASCATPRDDIASYVWDFNDGRDEREGRVVTRQYTAPGVFAAELTVTDRSGNQARTSKEIRVEEAPAAPPGGGTPGPANTADIQVSMSGPSSVAVGATATYVTRVRNNGPLTANGVSFNHSITGAFTGYAGAVTGGFSSCTFTPPSVSCSNASMAPGAFFEITVSVRATGGALTSSANATSASPPDTVSNNSARRVTAVPLKTLPAQEVEFLSEIESASPDRVRASIEMNGLGMPSTHAVGPTRHRITSRPGPNVIAGFATGSSLEGSLWEFDFSATEGFAPGSISVEAGEVVAISSHVVIFRLAGSETRIRFGFRMEP
jgi:uncharacterized repeat protein (TIGR01451 family)